MSAAATTKKTIFTKNTKKPATTYRTVYDDVRYNTETYKFMATLIYDDCTDIFGPCDSAAAAARERNYCIYTKGIMEEVPIIDVPDEDDTETPDGKPAGPDAIKTQYDGVVYDRKTSRFYASIQYKPITKTTIAVDIINKQIGSFSTIGLAVRARNEYILSKHLQYQIKPQVVNTEVVKEIETPYEGLYYSTNRGVYRAELHHEVGYFDDLATAAEARTEAINFDVHEHFCRWDKDDIYRDAHGR